MKDIISFLNSNNTHITYNTYTKIVTNLKVEFRFAKILVLLSDIPTLEGTDFNDNGQNILCVGILSLV